MHAIESPVDALERDLIRGRARWVADLKEFFRDYRFMDTVFDLYARGRTRNRGFFLSRFFAVTALPDYSVSLFCIDESRSGVLTTEKVRRRVITVLRIAEERSLKWSWLVILTNGKLPPAVVSYTERYDRRDLGLAIGSITSGLAVFSNNQLGRSIKSRMRLEKVLERTKNEEAN